jgi:hypothetical protein
LPEPQRREHHQQVDPQHVPRPLPEPTRTGLC